MYMSIFQNMRIRKLLALCIGVICIIGCGRTNIRETNNKEAGRIEVDIKEPGMKDGKREDANVGETS